MTLNTLFSSKKTTIMMALMMMIMMKERQKKKMLENKTEFLKLFYTSSFYVFDMQISISLEIISHEYSNEPTVRRCTYVHIRHVVSAKKAARQLDSQSKSIKKISFICTNFYLYEICISHYFRNTLSLIWNVAAAVIANKHSHNTEI